MVSFEAMFSLKHKEKVKIGLTIICFLLPLMALGKKKEENSASLAFKKTFEARPSGNAPNKSLFGQSHSTNNNKRLGVQLKNYFMGLSGRSDVIRYCPTGFYMTICTRKHQL